MTDGSGAIWTRTGRPFFGDADTTELVLMRLREMASRAQLWEELQTDWLIFDTEIMPWSAKASALIENQYAPVAAASQAGLSAVHQAVGRAAARGVEVADLSNRVADRLARSEKYAKAWAPYAWPVSGVDDLRVAPFHLLASEGTVHFDKPHAWHMRIAERLAAQDDPLLHVTNWREVSLESGDDCERAILWWEELTARGGEGMVVKPRDFVTQGAKGLIQPALKVRGREYLRIIYGPEYDASENLGRLKLRGLGGKRALALKEFALGHEALRRFVARQPLRRVHECVFAVLALESEPIDPRL